MSTTKIAAWPGAGPPFKPLKPLAPGDVETMRDTLGVRPTSSDRYRLTAAFTWLRRTYGFVARQNFGADGVTAIQWLARDVALCGRPAVLWTRQDARQFVGDELNIDGLFLKYGIIRPLHAAAAVNLDANRHVGLAVVQALDVVGLPHAWSTDPWLCIRVLSSVQD